MMVSKVITLGLLCGLGIFRLLTAAEAIRNRYWIDEVAGPIGELKDKGVELRNKVRELTIIEEDGRGSSDGRMTRWIRVYETQFPWMMLSSTEEKWDRKCKRATSRNYGERVTSPIIFADTLYREWGECTLPFEMPFQRVQLGNIITFLSHINEIPLCDEMDSARRRYRAGMPYPFTLISVPNDYNRLDVICDLRPWLAEGRSKDRYQDFPNAFHDAVVSKLATCEKDSPMRRIHIPLSTKWEHFLGKDITCMQKEFGECKLLFTCAFDAHEPSKTNINITCRTYSFNSGRGWFHTRQYYDWAECVYKIQVARDFYMHDLNAQETAGTFNPTRTWGTELSNSGIQRLSSNVCVMVTKDPGVFHWADGARIDLETEKTNAYHSISWMVSMPAWFPTTFSTNVVDMCQLSCLESQPREMFRVPQSIHHELGFKEGGMCPKSK